ncbi:MAG: tRNA (adenine-N1)-methyltransferase [Desulfurococcales archaeon]|nr:tRNA (adenine-N1)-methyltransferase [Desulfurococcales archaeon]
MSGEERLQSRAIKEGDYVLLYIDSRRRRLIRVRRGAVVNSDRGVLKHDDVIGRCWGDSVALSTGAKAHVLKPTFYDLLMSLPKRVTQVIYPKDIALMIMLSGIGYGSKVLEGGVGTGFLTAALAHTVGPEGHVYCYEIRKEFADVAKQNLKLLGLSDRVTIKVGDVRKDVTETELDAAFLDIPDPWNALSSLSKALKPSAPVLIFVPTVNQVIKVVKTLEEHKIGIDIHIYESILREYQPKSEALRPYTLMIGHTGYIVFFRLGKHG